MSNRWLKYILTAVIAVGVLLSFYLGWQRYLVEQANKQVEIALEWTQVENLANFENTTSEDILGKFYDTATGVVFKEQTVKDLQARGEVLLKKGTELSWELQMSTGRAQIPVQNSQTVKIKPDWNYLIFSDSQVMERVSANLKKSIGRGQMAEYYMQTPGGELLILGTSLTQDTIAFAAAGFDEEGMKLAAAQGYHIIPQIRSWRGVTDEGLDTVFSRFADLPVSVVSFNDEELPGVGLAGQKQQEVFQSLANRISDMNVPLGMIEFFPQKGLSTVAKYMDKNVVRLHAIPENEMPTISQSRAVDRFTLAVTDRNIRVLLVRFFPNMNVHDNHIYLEEIRDSLRHEGFTLGQPQTSGSLPFSRLYLIILAAAAAAGGILLFIVLGYKRLGLALGILGFLGAAGLIFMGQVSLARKALALISVIIFPTLAVTLNLKEMSHSIIGALVLFVRTTLVSLVGAALMVGFLADKSFMYTMDQFMGVKLAHVAPLFLVLLIFWFVKDPEKKPLKKIFRVLDYPVTVKYVVLLGILGVIMLIYIMRTGNQNAAVSSWELLIRSKLEYLLAVRPRTKEFLIGHPLAILMFYLGYRDRYLPLLMLGVIGQVSVVNTFAHIHTPLLISLIRAANGMWLGALIGIILIGCWKVWGILWKRLEAVNN